MAGDFNAKILTGSKLAATGSFTEEKILIPDYGKRGIVPAIVGIEVEHPTMNSLANKYSKWALCVKSNDAIPDLDDSEVIAASKRTSADAAQTSGPEEEIERVWFPAPIPISQTELYFQCMQDSGGNHTYRWRIHYVLRSIQGAVQKEAMLQSTQF